MKKVMIAAMTALALAGCDDAANDNNNIKPGAVFVYVDKTAHAQAAAANALTERILKNRAVDDSTPITYQTFDAQLRTKVNGSVNDPTRILKEIEGFGPATETGSNPCVIGNVTEEVAALNATGTVLVVVGSDLIADSALREGGKVKFADITSLPGFDTPGRHYIVVLIGCDPATANQLREKWAPADVVYLPTATNIQPEQIGLESEGI